VDVDAGGNLTVTDTREFCTFPFEPGDGSVVTTALAADAVTTAILENQARWRVHGAGMLKPHPGLYIVSPKWIMVDHDPFTYIDGGYNYQQPYWNPMNSAWRMQYDRAAPVWLTERVPEDFSGTDLDVYVWNTPDVTDTGFPPYQNPWPTTGSVVWDWNAWAGASGAAFAAQSGTTTVDNAGRTSAVGGVPGSPYMYRDLIGTITVSAGDLVHLEVYRDGLDGADTVVKAIKLMAVELAYTADS